ncbi:DNA polymerase kappa [Trametes pubescens]|uniref:DNA-directed DNA polymerase n=1 Tax=Trametes pubescens TaxID=154538 RepID=A0A1M2VH98_TRAPU|nr:DNA polymerase kappa [Trametes pubescens]
MPEKNMNPPSSTPDTASLLRRLAGPSVNKAGLAKDQTEINRIIAEASKGSKFYENKPNGQFKLDFDPEAVKTFMYDLSIRKVPGVGRVHERLLDSIGVKTCGDVFEHRAVLYLLDKHFGLEFLLQAYLGIASNVVQPGQREERKSIGAERTFNALSDTTKIHAKLEEVAAELETDMEESGWTGKTVTLKYKLDTFQVFTRAKSFDRWISTKKEDLFAIGQELLKPELPLTLRLIGLRVTKLKDLKAEAESKARGIKRFFESAPSSPKKKRRIDAPHDEEDEMPRLSQDGFAITMPGFDDDAEGDALIHPEGLAADAEAAEHPPARARSASLKPKSTSVPPARRSPSLKPSSSKTVHAPASSSRRSPTPSRGRDGDQAPSFPECPICGRMLETDNQGLNEHVDFCLSKQAIKEAQTASLKPSSSGQTAAQGKKPSRKPQSRQKTSRTDDKQGEGLLRYRNKG